MATFPELTRRLVRRWNRQARFYNLLTAPMERMLGFAPARAWVFERAAKGRVLEVGAGTGKNLPCYPEGAVVVATDLSPGMLGRAAGKTGGRMGNVRFVVTDAEDLAFKDGIFDAVVASFVFCTVPDPVRGLSEARRVWIRLRAGSWGRTSTAGRWITSERPAWSFWKSGTSSQTGSSSSWLDKEELR